MKTLEDLFADQLGDILDAEQRLAKALPKLAESTTHEELRDAFEAHLAETQGQAEKLEQVFRNFGKPVRAKKCEAIIGLIKEADEIASDNKGSPTLDAALIAAMQKVEHYEIASYGCLREWAEQLGNEEAARTLEEILDQERDADEKLTELAREVCNPAAEEIQEGATNRGAFGGVRGAKARAQMKADEEND